MTPRRGKKTSQMQVAGKKAASRSSDTETNDGCSRSCCLLVEWTQSRCFRQSGEADGQQEPGGGLEIIATRNPMWELS